MAPGKQAVAQPARKTSIDIAAYETLCMDLENWQEAADHCSALLEHQVGPSEQAAQKLLALAGAPADERLYAERLLAKCREERGQLEERLAIAVKQIAEKKARLEPIATEIRKQKEIRSAAAAMR